MKLIFELGVEGRGMTLMPECDVPEYQLPEERSEALRGGANYRPRARAIC